MAGKEKKAKQAIALSEIFIIVCATVAFAFILGSSQSVSAVDYKVYQVDGKLYSSLPSGKTGVEVYLDGTGKIYDKPESASTRTTLGVVDYTAVLNGIGGPIKTGGFSQVDIAGYNQAQTTPAAVTPTPVVAESAPVESAPAAAQTKSTSVNVPSKASAPKVDFTQLASGANSLGGMLSKPTEITTKDKDGKTVNTYSDITSWEKSQDGKTLTVYRKDGHPETITDPDQISSFTKQLGFMGTASTSSSAVAAFYDSKGVIQNTPAASFKNVLDPNTHVVYNGLLVDKNGDVWQLDANGRTYTRADPAILDAIKKDNNLISNIPKTTDPVILEKLGWNKDSTISTATIDGKSFSGTLYRDPTDASKAIFIDTNGNQRKIEASIDKTGKAVWKENSPGEDLSKIAGKTAGGHLTEALVWAGGFAALVQIIGATGIIEKNTANAITVAGVAGIVVWKGLVAFDAARGKGPTWVSKYGGLIGIGVAAVVFWLMYKKSEKRIVSLECLPFEPPIGGKNCEKCNANPFSPCSEYRCKALGQACTLLNPGTGKELCAWESKFDVKSATIQPLKSVLNPNDLKYIEDTSLRPNAKGVKIVRGSNGCLQAFTPLVFGITTNKPTQCKIDYSHTSSYGEMQYLFGGENYYSYNHTQRMKLPTPEGSANDTETPELKNDGTYSLYVRCQDVNGNQNVDEYSVSFCVDASEDTTPPMIEKASIISGSPVRYMVDSVPIEIYVNEPADCKWSRTDKPYEDMENGMSCASDASQINNDLLYTCSGNLTGVKDKEDNKFFFRCKDNPGKEENRRNVMVQSWPSTSGFILKGSRPLIITNVAPNGTLFGSTTTVNVNLQVETSSGAEEGKAICMFSPSGVNGTYLNMYETENYISKQSLDLTSGNYRYYFRCNDAGGNTVENSTAFSVQVDKSSPLVTRVYKEVPDALKIITSEDAECAYSLTSCNFEFNDGIKMIYSNPSIKNVHFAEWKPSSVYYLRCRDFYNNEPSSGACNLIVSAVKLTSERVDA